MAKISISGVLAKRKWTRIGTGVALLALVFFIVQLLIIDNPKRSKAINADTIISASDHTTYDNTDVTISNATVTIYGTHNFKSLIINSGGKLTHAALVPITDFNMNTSVLTASGQDKKVDITVTGDITLNGGSIDVDGMGYPGSHIDSSNCNTNQGPIIASTRGGNYYGFGPGGGIAYRTTDHHYGGGAGYGGIGKMGGTDMTGDSGLGSLTYSNDNLTPGSGGGSGSHGGDDYGQSRDVTLINGGDGGGIISIKANSIIINNTASKISANGTDAKAGVCVESNDVGGGGGSGGVISIQTNNINVLSTKNNGSTVSGGLTGGQTGQYTISGFNDNNSVPLYFTALGGIGANDNGGTLALGGGPGGGGGWIVLSKLNVSAPPGVSIKKVLSPKERPIGTPNTNFNPYALQKDDVIQVSLDVSNITDDFYLTDEFLITPGINAMKCLPDPTNPADPDTAYSVSPFEISSTFVKWQVTSGGGANINRYYYCKVQ